MNVATQKKKVPIRNKPTLTQKSWLVRQESSTPTEPNTTRYFWGLLGSWGLALLALLSLPNAEFLVPKYSFFARQPFYPFLITGFAGMVYFFRKFRPYEVGEDVSSRASRPVFFLFMALGAVLRLYDLHRISGCIDPDHWIYANEALQIMVAGDRPILLPYGTREPLFAYISAGIWSLMPHATAIVAMRVSSVVVDMFILWSFYLLGREVDGRRGGLILMGMGAISKTLIQISKINFGFHTDVLACALTVMFLFRLLRDPKLSSFMGWALSLVFGSYLYVAFRLWTPGIIGGLWLWMMWRPELRPKTRAGMLLAWGVMLGWTFAFFYVNNVLPHTWTFVQFFGKGPGFYLILAVLGALFLHVAEESRYQAWVWKWASGSLLIALLLGLLWAQPGYSDHPNEMVIFHPRFELTKWEATKYCIHNFWNGFRVLFSWDPDNPFWNLPPMKGDSYMDFFVPAFGLLALAWFVGRPSLIEISILVLWFVGYAAYFLTHGAHTNRLMATLLPMYLIGARGAFRLWHAFRDSGLKAGAKWGTALFLAFGAWSLFTNIQILEGWMNMRWNDTLAQDVLDTLPTQRCYLQPHPGHFGETGLDLVCEGRDAHLALDSNPIDLVEGQRGKDIAVVIWGSDDATRDRLNKAFPGGIWKEKVSAWPITSLKWMIVPFDQISQNPSDYYYIRYKPASYWQRRFYLGLGLGRGMIRYEDRMARWNEPVPPPFLNGEYVGRIDGEWDVQVPGDYEVGFQTANTTQLWVDGREVLEMKRPVGNLERKAKLHLSPGKHRVEFLTAFLQEHQFPTVRVHSLAEGWDKPLDELSGTQLPVSPMDSTTASNR
ncbi:MAG TPA: hypothetical protein VMV05_05140 [bacterium]|nr:hypothetical protein [bacterium]